MVGPLVYYGFAAGPPIAVLLWVAMKPKPPSLVAALAWWAVLVAFLSLGPSTPGLAGLLALPILALARGTWSGRAARRACAAVSVLGIGGVAAADVAQVRFVAFEAWRAELAAARADYPPVPRDDLLPQPPPVALPQAAPHPGGADWYAAADEAAWEAEDDFEPTHHVDNLHRLLTLHDDWAGFFTVQRGFGVVRMGRLWRRLPESPDTLPDRPGLPQPSGAVMVGPLQPAPDELADADLTALADWHAARGLDFVNAPGFGLLAGVPGEGEVEPDRFDRPPLAVTDRLPVAADTGEAPFLIGFRSHAAGTPPGEPLAPGWTLATVDLIGLVTHAEPVAYASRELPRMGERSEHVVRSLTDFEREALPRLAAGEWVVAGADGDRLRAVGALPAARACAECHGVERGRLLGALSYEFARPEPPILSEAP